MKSRHAAPVKWLLKGAASLFFVAAIFQWTSYNMMDMGGEARGAFSLIMGWVWTVLIAAPGLLLWGYAERASGGHLAQRNAPGEKLPDED